MSLYEYKQKRTFTTTPEPAGKITTTSGQLVFCVQKHHASHLHYDFRLELNGVMKSWAIPKGPSLNPDDKRLAMMVEDHPLDYRTFEGIIPKGNYGAGEVIVWDEGMYAVYGSTTKEDMEKSITAQLAKGHLTFVLNGTKLKGEFALVRQHTNEDNAWLLIKKDDAYTSTEDITKNDTSVRTNRTLEALIPSPPPEGTIATDGGLQTSKTIQITFTDDLQKSPMPHSIKPMLASTAQEVFDNPDWLFEIKWDGYRAIAEIEKGNVSLYSRNGKDFSQQFEPIYKALQQIAFDCVLDGEMVVLDEHGKASFQLLQQYMDTKKGTLVYYIFDLLYYNGYDLRNEPLIKRKELLQQALPTSPTICFSDHILEKGKDFLQLAKSNGLEGIMAKKADSTYIANYRSHEWFKMKLTYQQEAVICGYTQPRRGRKYIGALVLGVYEDNKLRYIGHTGTGFTSTNLADVKQLLDPYKTNTSPFTDIPKTNAPVQWLKPKLLCEVKFSEWTQDGHMRHPVFLGLRQDKAPQQVSKEPDSVQKVNNTITHSQSTFSNLSKIYWPDEGITKGELISYYEQVADVMLPYLIDRPQVLHRYPHGIQGESFYQKNIEDHPAWIPTVPVRSEHEERTITYLLCQNKETLLYLANLGCIDINPWNSRVTALDKPDYFVIDLDPLDISFDYVVKTALATKSVLDHFSLPGYCKTSGATGLHIYIPLEARYHYDTVRQFAELLAYMIHKEVPTFTSIERSPTKRQGKVYIDFLQNRFGQTLAAPYSIRPMPYATVSTPLLWEEVTEKLHPTQFTLKNILHRIETIGDLWKPVLGKGIDIENSLQRTSSPLQEI